MSKQSKRWVFIGLIVLVIFAILYFFFRDRFDFLNVKSVATYLRNLGPWAILLGGLFIVIQTFFPIVPFLVLAGANVLVSGLWGGFLVNWISAVIGSVLMFFIARTVGRKWAEKKVKKYPKVRSVNQFITKNGFKTIFVLRLVPMVPPVGLNLAAGLSTISIRSYILATVFGKIPAIFLESMIGHDLFHFSHHKTRLFLLLCFAICAVLVGMKVVKKKVKAS